MGFRDSPPKRSRVFLNGPPFWSIKTKRSITDSVESISLNPAWLQRKLSTIRRIEALRLDISREIGEQKLPGLKTVAQDMPVRGHDWKG
jgi:hypothetical protein